VIGLFSPSYLSRLEEELIEVKNVELNYIPGKRSGIYFESKGKKYFAYCRNLFDQGKNNFCSHSFPLKNSNIKADLILYGLYENSQNIIVIKEVNWKSNNEINKFIISKIEYENSVDYIRYNNYFIRFLSIISFFIVNILIFIKLRNI
ncbi:hypothetical protein, partial [Neisseria wadsworthii]